MVAVACADLDRQYGGTHTIGPPGTEYNNLRLLGAVDIAGKRYGRLEWYGGSWACVPWIDAFAELVGQNISVVWEDHIQTERIFRVSGRDGHHRRNLSRPLREASGPSAPGFSICFADSAAAISA